MQDTHHVPAILRILQLTKKSSLTWINHKCKCPGDYVSFYFVKTCKGDISGLEKHRKTEKMRKASPPVVRRLYCVFIIACK